MNLDLIEVYKYLHLSSFFKRKTKRVSDWLTGEAKSFLHSFFSPSSFFSFPFSFRWLDRKGIIFRSDSADKHVNWQRATQRGSESERNIRFSYLDALMVSEWLYWFRHNIVRLNFQSDRSLVVYVLVRVCRRQELRWPFRSVVRWLELSFHSGDGECIPRRRRTSVKDVQAKRQLMTTLG